jgi:aryl-alcohol dehydrogenase-like predicted oxidoreductase
MATIGLGMAAIGRPGYINLGHAEDLAGRYSISAMRANAHAVLDAAWDLGVRYFDTARSYGRAESFLGDWIRAREISPGEIVVGSKWGYTYTAAWQVQTPKGVEHEVKRHELSVLQSQYGATLKNLGTHLSLYQIHSATPESGVLENQAILELLNRIREAGIKVGLSVTGPNQSETIDQAIAIKFDDQPLFGSVQATWNLLETSAGPALQRANEAGLDVIIKEGLANGRLTPRNQSSGFEQQRALLHSLSEEMNATVDALSLVACLNQPWATIVLSGAATVEHLQSNLKARDVRWNTEIERRLESLVESPNEYWETRAGLAWN